MNNHAGHRRRPLPNLGRTDRNESRMCSRESPGNRKAPRGEAAGFHGRALLMLGLWVLPHTGCSRRPDTD